MLSPTSRPLEDLLKAFSNASEAIQKHNIDHGLEGPFQNFLAGAAAALLIGFYEDVPECFTPSAHRRAQEQLVRQWGAPLARFGIEIAFQPFEGLTADDLPNVKMVPKNQSPTYEGSQAYLVALSVPTLLRYLEPLSSMRSDVAVRLVGELAEGIEKQLEDRRVRSSNDTIFRELLVHRERLGEIFNKCDVPLTRLKSIASALGKYSQ